MPDECDDIYERVERVVDAILRKAHRLKLQLETPSLPSLDRISSGGARTTPSDLRCWMIDIERCTVNTGRWTDAGSFVHVASPDIVVGVLVRGERHATLAERHGISRRLVGEILHAGVVSIFLQFAAAGIDYDHRVTIAEAS